VDTAEDCRREGALRPWYDTCKSDHKNISIEFWRTLLVVVKNMQILWRTCSRNVDVQCKGENASSRDRTNPLHEQSSNPKYIHIFGQSSCPPAWNDSGFGQSPSTKVWRSLSGLYLNLAIGAESIRKDTDECSLFY
jgi:hypothetical protein